MEMKKGGQVAIKYTQSPEAPWNCVTHTHPGYHTLSQAVPALHLPRL